VSVVVATGKWRESCQTCKSGCC